MVFMQFVLVLRMKGRDNFEESANDCPIAESSLQPLPIAPRGQLFPDRNFLLKILLLQYFNLRRAFPAKSRLSRRLNPLAHQGLAADQLSLKNTVSFPRNSASYRRL